MMGEKKKKRSEAAPDLPRMSFFHSTGKRRQPKGAGIPQRGGERSCGAGRGAPGMAARGPARFGPWQWLLAAAGAAAAVWDAGADVWVAVGYARAGQPGCAALGLGLWAAGSAARQACSWLWFRSDPSTLRPELSRRPLAALHLLQLGFLYRYGPPEPRRPPAGLRPRPRSSGASPAPGAALCPPVPPR